MHYYLNVLSESESCDTVFREELMNGLTELLKEEELWCPDIFEGRPIVTRSELECYRQDSIIEERCLLKRNNSIKYIEISRPYILEEEAVFFVVDSGCSEEVYYLEKVLGRWEISCMATLLTC